MKENELRNLFGLTDEEMFAVWQEVERFETKGYIEEWLETEIIAGNFTKEQDLYLWDNADLDELYEEFKELITEFDEDEAVFKVARNYVEKTAKNFEILLT